MKKIHLNEIEDYRYCPMLHYLKYELGFNNFDINDISRANNTYKNIWTARRSENIINTLLFTLKELRNKGKINKSQIEAHFGKEFFNGMETADILAFNKSKTSGADSYLIDYGLLKQMIKRFFSKKMIPIIANQEFETKIDGILLKGKIEAVLQIEGQGNKVNLYEFFCPQTKSVSVSKIMANYDIQLLFGSYVLQEDFDVEMGYKTFYHITQNVEQGKTLMTEKDIIIFKDIISSTLEDIDKKISRPSPGIQKCNDCKYLRVCNEYHQ